MSRKYSTADFIARARIIHGDKYDYSAVQYLDSITPVRIICPDHGEFFQRPAMHLSGQGCKECGKKAVVSALSDNRESFIAKANKVHGTKYDYSLVEYQGSDKKVTIICPTHGTFEQTPHMHIRGNECPMCGRIKSDLNRRKGLDFFLQQAHDIHGDRYDYTKVQLTRRDRKVCIICPEHGEFWQTPDNHINQKQGCPICAREYVGRINTKDTVWFLNKAHEIHGDRYDYSETKYVSAREKLCVICHEKDDGGIEHGRFWLTPHQHLSHSGGCPKCGHPKHTLTWWINEAHKVHGNRYDYSKVDYRNNHDPITIICPDHGEFLQLPFYHLKGGICPKCNGRNLSTEEIISQFEQVHGHKYRYSLVEYANKTTPVEIICPKHGPFLQTPAGHLRGNGCPICNESHLEAIMGSFLRNQGIKFQRQKTFDWLKYQGYMYLDYYLLEHNIAIECQGLQHFEPVDFMGGKEGHVVLLDRDRVKESLCTSHGINVLYFSDLGIDYPYPVFEDLEQLLDAIHNEGDFNYSTLTDSELPLVFDE